MFQAQTEIHTLPTVFMIQLVLALKTRLCVYMYLPHKCVYIYVYIATNVHSVVCMENLNLWGCGFYPPWYLRRKRNNNMSQIPQLGKNKYNFVGRAYQLCLYKYTHIYRFIYKHTYTNNMEYTYTHTLALNSVSHYIIYCPSLEAVFSSFDSGNGWLSSNKTEMDVSKRLWFYGEQMAFQDPSVTFGGYCLNSADPILSTLSLTNISSQQWNFCIKEKKC